MQAGMRACGCATERERALDETEIEGSAEIPQILFRIANKILRARRRLPSSRPEAPESPDQLVLSRKG